LFLYKNQFVTFKYYFSNLKINSMAYGKNVSSSTLNQWIHNFRSNNDLPFTTNAAAVSLNQLENFIKEAKTKYPASLTGFKIYLIRYPMSEGDPVSENIEKAGRNLSQPSMVLVPVKNYDHSIGSGDDFVLENPGDLYVLAFSDPQSPDPADTTVLCPPKCGGG
jgi:hypothetical protein